MASDPGLPEAAYRLAVLYADDGHDLRYALDLARRAQLARPGDAAPTDALGWVYIRSDSYNLGLPHLREAVRLAPDNPLYRYHLGVAQLQRGNRTEARAELEPALALGPKFPRAEEARRALSSISP